MSSPSKGASRDKRRDSSARRYMRYSFRVNGKGTNALRGAVQGSFAAATGPVRLQDIVAFVVDRGIEDPRWPFPPSGPAGRLPPRQITRRQASRQGRQPGGTWARSADIEHTWLIMPILPGHQTVPVTGAEKGPDGDGADIDTALLEPVGLLPNLGQPAHLLIRCRPQMGLGNGDRPVISLPCLFQ